MNPAATRPVLTPELIARFVDYHQRHPGWAVLHIVMEDDNIADSSVRWCIDRAAIDGDVEGGELAEVLLSLTRSQRARLARRA